MPADALDPDLLCLAAVWFRLPPPIRAAVVALVRTAVPADGPAGAGLDDVLPPGFERHTIVIIDNGERPDGESPPPPFP